MDWKNEYEGSVEERQLEALQRIAEELVFLNESLLKIFDKEVKK